MKKRKTAVAVAAAAALLCAVPAFAADSSYLSVKGGVFLPNGRDSGDYKGFKYFDTGYNVDVAVGYRPESYAALEVGTGFYTAAGTVRTQDFTIDRTAYGIPVTLTAKGILEFTKLVLSAGAGLGYYQGFIENNISFASAVPPVNETNHGGALGYQAVLDADLKMSDRWLVGANFKWFSARPSIELKNVQNNQVVTTKDKWEIGGTVINVGMKYLF
jgi:outer membrane protein W